MAKLDTCPFCGWEPPDDSEDPDALLDVLHMSTTWWGCRMYGGEMIKTYLNFSRREPGDQPCWEMNCTENMGGCGVSMTADSKEEVVTKWNRRTAKTKGEAL